MADEPVRELLRSARSEGPQSQLDNLLARLASDADDDEAILAELTSDAVRLHQE